MSNANRMVPGPGGEPTGPKKPGTTRLPTKAEVKKGLLDTTVEPENALSPSELKVIELKQKIRAKVLEILQRKAGLLAELKEITDYETLLQRLGSYFIEMTEAINNLVSEIYNNRKILGLEAAEELIEEIQNNSLCLDPEKDGDLINELEAELAELAKLSQNPYQLETPLNLVPRDQSALRNKLKQFKKRVEEALKRNNYEELKGLVEEISALEIMQVYPFSSSTIISEREACELRFEYDQLRSSAHYQAILILDGGKKLKDFKKRVQAALRPKNDKEQLKKKQLEDLVKELKGLIEEISALEIMQVYPSPSSLLLSERKAYELRVEYEQLKRSAHYQIILILEGGNTLEQFRRRVQAALRPKNDKELKGLIREILALKIMQMQFYPDQSSPLLPEIEAYKLRVEYEQLKRGVYYQIILNSEGGNTLEQFRERVRAALNNNNNNNEELEGLVKKILALEIMQVFPDKSSSLPPERKAYELKAEYQSMIEEVQGKLEKLRSST